jgi:hypothetical protein
MPELPQIQPTSGISLPGVVSVSAGDVGSTVAKTAGDIQDQAYEMGRQAQEMNRNINFHAADADYITGSSQIFHDTRSIQDPDQLNQIRTQALTDLSSKLAKQYAAAGPELAPQLALRRAEDMKRSDLESQALGVTNARDNLDALHDKTIVAATSAQANQVPGILQGYQDSVNSVMQKGFIGQGTANKYNDKMVYDMQFAMVSKAADEDPIAVMNMTPEQAHLKPQDLSLIQWRAGGIMERKDHTASREFQAIQNANDELALQGKLNLAQAWELYRFGKLSSKGWQTVSGQPPANYGLADSLSQYLIDHPEMSPEQINMFMATHGSDPNLRGPGREKVTSMANAMRENSTTTFGEAKKTMLTNINARIEAKYPWTAINPDDRIKMNNEKGLAASEVNGSHDNQELSQVGDRWYRSTIPPVKKTSTTADDLKKLQKLFDVK